MKLLEKKKPNVPTPELLSVIGKAAKKSELTAEQVDKILTAQGWYVASQFGEQAMERRYKNKQISGEIAIVVGYDSDTREVNYVGEQFKAAQQSTPSYLFPTWVETWAGMVLDKYLKAKKSWEGPAKADEPIGESALLEKKKPNVPTPELLSVIGQPEKKWKVSDIEAVLKTVGWTRLTAWPYAVEGGHVLGMTYMPGWALALDANQCSIEMFERGTFEAGKGFKGTDEIGWVRAWDGGKAQNIPATPSIVVGWAGKLTALHKPKAKPMPWVPKEAKPTQTSEKLYVGEVDKAMQAHGWHIEDTVGDAGDPEQEIHYDHPSLESVTAVVFHGLSYEVSEVHVFVPGETLGVFKGAASKLDMWLSKVFYWALKKYPKLKEGEEQS